MKRFVLLILVTFVVLMSQGQKVKRTTAFNYLNDEDYAKAIEFIEPTISHEKTMHDAKTWYYRSKIYINAYVRGDSALKVQYPDALDRAYESLVKATELDSRGDYTDDINYSYKVIGPQYFNEAAAQWNLGNFDKAGEYFIKTFTVSQKFGVYDTNAVQNAGLAYFNGEYFEKTKEVYIGMVEANAHTPVIYSTLYNVFIKENDTAAAIEYLSKGLEIYPQDNEMLVGKINLYLAQGNSEMVIKSIEQAIANDPTNPQFYSVAGQNYEKLGNNEKAVENYLKAIEIDSNNYDGNYGLGAFYNNQAGDIRDGLDDIPLSETEKYDKQKAEANEYLKKAYPYLEKAYEINPEYLDPLEALHKIYIILKMNDELKTVNERLKK